MTNRKANGNHAKDMADSPNASDEQRQGNINQSGTLQQDIARQHGIGQTDKNQPGDKG